MSENKTLPSTLKNMVLVLLVISLLVGGVLSAVYILTHDAISQVELSKKISAISKVLPDFDNDILASARAGVIDSAVTVYTARKGAIATGWAVETYSKSGYSGEIRIMVGFGADGRIRQWQVLSHAETPGLGSKMTKPGFQNQFLGKHADSFNLRVRKDGGDVDAIAAATISSRAVCEALVKAWKEADPLIKAVTVSQ